MPVNYYKAGDATAAKPHWAASQNGPWQSKVDPYAAPKPDPTPSMPGANGSPLGQPAGHGGDPKQNLQQYNTLGHELTHGGMYDPNRGGPGGNINPNAPGAGGQYVPGGYGKGEWSGGLVGGPKGGGSVGEQLAAQMGSTMQRSNPGMAQAAQMGRVTPQPPQQQMPAPQAGAPMPSVSPGAVPDGAGLGGVAQNPTVGSFLSGMGQQFTPTPGNPTAVTVADPGDMVDYLQGDPTVDWEGVYKTIAGAGTDTLWNAAPDTSPPKGDFVPEPAVPTRPSPTIVAKDAYGEDIGALLAGIDTGIAGQEGHGLSVIEQQKQKAINDLGGIMGARGVGTSPATMGAGATAIEAAAIGQGAQLSSDLARQSIEQKLAELQTLGQIAEANNNTDLKAQIANQAAQLEEQKIAMDSQDQTHQQRQNAVDSIWTSIENMKTAMDIADITGAEKEAFNAALAEMSALLLDPTLSPDELQARFMQLFAQYQKYIKTGEE